MSTGENINANGAKLTVEMVRLGFHMFPQTVQVLAGPALWPQIPAIQTTADYPFSAEEEPGTPPGELWFLGTGNELLGRIVNIAS